MPRDENNYRAVDQAFYEEVRNQNGGELPPDLVTPDGKPRQLTRSKEDRKYRRLWKKTRKEVRKSKATNRKAMEPCQPCAQKRAQKATKQQQKDEPCKHTGLTVERTDTSPAARKGHKVVKLKGAAKPTSEQIEVLAGTQSNPAKFKAKVNLAKGPCNSVHKDRVLALSDQTAISPGSDLNREMEFELVYDGPQATAVETRKLWNNIWPTKFSPATTTLRCQTCTGESYEVGVSVYPDIKWSASIEFGYMSDEEGTDTKGTFTRDRASKSLEVRGSLTRHLNQPDTMELEGEFKKYVSDSLKILNATKKMIECVSTGLASTCGVKLEARYPHARLNGDWGWRERKEDLLVAYFGKIALEIDPVLGAKATWDITEPLLALLPGGPALVKLKQRLEKGVGKKGSAHARVDLGIKLSVKGDLFLKLGSLDIEWRPKTDHKHFKYDNPQIGGKVGFEIRGGGDIEGQLWVVHGAAGAQAGAKSSITMSYSDVGWDKEGLYLGAGKLKLSGLEVYAYVYYGIHYKAQSQRSRRKTSAGSPVGDERRFTKERSDMTEKKGGHKDERRVEATILEPETFPKGDGWKLYILGG